MKPRANSFLFTLSIAALLLGAPSSLFAQLADIPVKPGLWETHMIAKMGAHHADKQPFVTQACFTVKMTLYQYVETTNKAAPDVKCSVANKVQTPRHLAFDTACTNHRGSTSKSHADFQLSDAEHFSGTNRMIMNGKSLHMTIIKTFTGKYLSAACGNVHPLAEPSNSK